MLLRHCCWCGRGFTDDDRRQTTTTDADRRQRAKQYWPIRWASNKIELVGLSLVLAPESDIKLTRLKSVCLHYIVPHHGSHNSWHR